MNWCNKLVRLLAWFGLDQAALALYLGASPALIRLVETGRRVYHRRATSPAPAAAAPIPGRSSGAHTPSYPIAGPARPQLGRQRGQPHPQQAAKLGRELAALEARTRMAVRWAQDLPALLRAAAEAHATPAPDNPERGTWLADRMTWQARPLPTKAATQAPLLRVRLAGLAAALAPSSQQL